MTWKPGQAKARLELETPYEDVPAHLHTPLLEWVRAALDSTDAGNSEQLAISLRVGLPSADASSINRLLIDKCKANVGFHLDLIESLLEREPRPLSGDNRTSNTLASAGIVDWARIRRRDLDRILENGNSAYRVNIAGDGLEQRITAGVEETVSKAIDNSSDSAAAHLTSAWNAVYGLKSDPTKGYSEAIKAVECALAPVISPQNLKQTLGTMIKDVTQKPSKWVVAGSDSEVPTILAMMKTLWTGQTSRHGGLNPTRPETGEEAAVALHLAAALVQLGSNGEFRVK